LDLVGEESEQAQSVADYIAGMTDRFAIKAFTEIFLPQPW
jgi:dGTP triphosphohydrolase